MKLSLLAAFSSLALVATAWPTGSDFSLVGYAKDNPIGLTTGGKKGPTVTVSDPAALASAVAGDDPKTVYLKGTFELPSRLQVGSNKSIIGLGKGAEIRKNGLNVFNSSNVIIRNLGIRFILNNDGITIQNSTRIWIDHNEFESDINHGPDYCDGQCDIVRGSDWVTVSWNYFHDHWKSSLVGNSDAIRDVDFGKLHITYHHNYWRNEGTRGPAGRFGHQHVFNNLYVDFLYQAIHSRSDNQVLVEGNVFRGNTREALSTYGLVIPEDSPNTSPDGDFEIDGFGNLENDWGTARINITRVGDFTRTPYKYKLTPLKKVEKVVKAGAGLGKI
ncbi:polysaccharide lyase family 1 protein [Zopfia rhizophila CBS 207.26]|uniref:Polysaccharide lyase family 1 protein n=1 Tax=Zopfia rhizophila CBS 207.26 TaxID=1314779 RepID=A0A6A6DKL7_9PEZI|nr:polysaccharide lyase family 1 protein [Zopfia rhizophila CBS 207.26]